MSLFSERLFNHRKVSFSQEDMFEFLRDLRDLQDSVNAITPGAPIINNLVAVTDPTVNDDSADGYTTSSIWFNTVSDTFWACTDATVGAAVWQQGVVGGSGLVNNMTAVVAPTANDDSGDGYTVNSGWFDTVSGILYFCQDATLGAAVWTPVPSASAASVIFNNNVYVSKNGSNATGAINDLSKPFLTIAAARTAAIAAGGTWAIRVQPGDYSEAAAITLTNGINIFFEGTGTLTTSAGTTIFQCVTGATNTIHAPGWSFNATGSRHVLTTNGLSGITLNFVAKNVTSVSGVNFYLNSSTSNIFIDADYCYTLSGFANVYGDVTLNGSNVYMNVRKFRMDGTDRIIDLQKGNFFLTSQQMLASTGAAIYVQSSNANCKMFFDVQEINCGGTFWPVWFAGTSTNMGFRCTRLVGASDCLLISDDGGTLFADVQSIHSNYNGTQDGIVHAEGSTMYLSNATITRAGTAVGGGDIKTSGASPKLYLKDVTYDITRINIATKGQAEYWNGSGFTDVPHVQNNAVASGNAITECNLTNCTVNFATFTGCTLSGVTAIGKTITFSENNQTISPEITWANLMTALSGSALVDGMEYHSTTAPDSSTTIDEVWVRATASDELSPTGRCLVNAANITDRIMDITFNFNLGAGFRVQGVKDERGNEIEVLSTDGTPMVDRWLDFLTAANEQVKILGGTLAAAPSGTIGDKSKVSGTLQIGNTSFFSGVIEYAGQAVVGTDADSTVNECIIDRTGSLSASGGVTVGACYIGPSKSVDITAYDLSNWSTEGSNAVQLEVPTEAGTTTVNPGVETLVLAGGALAQLTIELPAGLVTAQKLFIKSDGTIASISWGSSSVAGTVPATIVGDSTLTLVWDTAGPLWY